VALEKLLAAGRLGRKSGRGFYIHRGRKRTRDPQLRAFLGLQRERHTTKLEMLSERMVLAMINEGARCLEDGVVADAGLLDLALVFGAGFPPFRGGLMRHADSLGLAHVVVRLGALAAERGARFQPAPSLKSLAERGGSFTGMPSR
jgi:3-hydroxyacyl-CoA dehydrogenase/enoyl-CoA hydratase/3-hydroxybutyryl-CoA epimerase